MRGIKTSTDKVNEAISLRKNERLGITEISKRTGISKSSLSPILREWPLTKQETRRCSEVGRATRKANSKLKEEQEISKLFKMAKDLTRAQKGAIAESAVYTRLLINGFEPWKQFHDGRIDLLIRTKGNSVSRIAIRWVSERITGRPVVRLQTTDPIHGNLISQNHCDYVIGYHLKSDTAFVFPPEIWRGKKAIACNEIYAEKWDLLPR
jgi:hypothetical protein